MHYVAYMAPCADGLSICFPDLPGCASGGKDLEDALRNGAEALSLHVGNMIRDGMPVPEPSSMEGAREIMEDLVKEADEDLDEGAFYAPVVFELDDDIPDETPVRMTISLKPNLVRRLDAVARDLGLSRSAVISLAAREYCLRHVSL